MPTTVRGATRHAPLLVLVMVMAFVVAPRAAADTAVVHVIGTPVTVGASGNEPIVKSGPDGTLYIAALEYLYVSTTGGKTWVRTPGTLYNNPPGNGGVNLNTDSSIDVDPGNRLYFTFDWPYAGTTAVCRSDDHAQSFTCDTTTVPGGTDRMWLVAPSTTEAHLVTNEGAYQTLFYNSGDRGGTWSGSGTTTMGLNPDTGPLLKSPLNGLIYQPYVNNATNATATTNLNSGPIGFHVFNPAVTPQLSSEVATTYPAPNALPSAGFTRDGTLYLVTETATGPDYRLTIARSPNDGASWTTLPAIPGTGSGTQTFSAVATGAAGHVGVIYYTTAAGGDPTVATGAVWNVMWAESTDANTASPHWTVQTVEANVHTGPICSTAGCTGDNRYSGDFISASFDASDSPHLTWIRDLDSTGNHTQVRYAGAANPGNALPEAPYVPGLVLMAALIAAVGVRRAQQR